MTSKHVQLYIFIKEFNLNQKYQNQFFFFLNL